MLSFTHSGKQKEYLQWKADRINSLFGRNCKVGSRDVFDSRTEKVYESCQYTMTSTELNDVYDLFYPSGKKVFTEEALADLDLESLAILWMDDGNLEPKKRIGRLNLYEDEMTCKIVADWIESLTGCCGVYEDYEGNNVGRLRFRSSDMGVLAFKIAPFICPLMSYKVDLQYVNNTKNKFLMSVASPGESRHEVSTLPLATELSHREWQEIAKNAGVGYVKSGTKESLRFRIVENLKQRDLLLGR